MQGNWEGDVSIKDCLSVVRGCLELRFLNLHLEYECGAYYNSCVNNVRQILCKS